MKSNPSCCRSVLAIPVRLRHEEALRNRRPRFGPEFGRRRCARLQTLPRVRENVGEHQHRHVAPHAVGVFRHLPQLADERSPHLHVAVIQLRHIGPRREKRIAAARDEPNVAIAQLDRPECGGRLTECRGVSGDEPVRVVGHPGMVEPDMVGDEIDNQVHAARVQCVARRSKSGQAAHPVVGLVARDAECRPDDVARLPSRSGIVVGGEQGRFTARELAADPAPTPDPHEVHEIDATITQAGPHIGRDRLQRQPLSRPV